MSVLINYSDLAATGVEPIGILLSTIMPNEMRTHEYSQFLQGVKVSCDAWGGNLLGGNVKDGKEFSVIGTAIGGQVNNNILTRIGSNVGDAVCIVGDPGVFCEMCKLASSFLSLPVETRTFDQINYCNEFDGIWACSSLLHVPKSEIVDILHKIVKKKKKNAIMYTCFKYGTSETIKDGCHYSCYDEIQLENLLKEVDSMSLLEMWKSYDVLRHKNTPQWINIIIQINKN